MENHVEIKRKLTKKEILTGLYNTLLLRATSNEVDMEFFKRKAEMYKEGSPEANQAMQDHYQQKTNRALNLLTLQVIEEQLTSLEKDEKVKN